MWSYEKLTKCGVAERTGRVFLCPAGDEVSCCDCEVARHEAITTKQSPKVNHTYGNCYKGVFATNYFVYSHGKQDGYRHKKAKHHYKCEKRSNIPKSHQNIAFAHTELLIISFLVVVVSKYSFYVFPGGWFHDKVVYSEPDEVKHLFVAGVFEQNYDCDTRIVAFQFVYDII